MRVELGGTSTPVGLLEAVALPTFQGDTEQAITVLLERWAVLDAGTRSWFFSTLRYGPEYSPIRDDPRVQQLFADHAAVLAAQRHSATAGAVAVAQVDEKSVAVLAFTNLSDDKDNEYFSDGISEELLNVLAKVPGLKVSARTSAFYFKGKQVQVAEIARQLGVAYVVEGSVRKSGPKVRITAQLIKAADGFQVWSDDFDRELKDVFAVQDEIAGLIAKNLQLKLDDARRSSITVPPEAYRLYLEGRQQLLLRNRAGFARAQKLFDAARAIAPEWAPLYAALADVNRLRAMDSEDAPHAPGAPWSAQLQQAKELAERSLALDPNLAEGYVALAGTMEIGWDLTAAERWVQRAIELNPNSAEAFLILGRLESVNGRMDESLAALHHAQELNPLAPRILDNLASQLAFADRFEEGWAAIERAYALQPDGTQIGCYRLELLIRRGQRDEALRSARALSEDPQPENLNFRRYEAVAAFSAFGQQEEAEALLKKTDTNSAERPMALAAMGRPQEAIALLDQVDFSWIEEVLWEHYFDPIRTDPKFLAYLAKMNLLEAHQRAMAWRAAHRAGPSGR